MRKIVRLLSLFTVCLLLCACSAAPAAPGTGASQPAETPGRPPSPEPSPAPTESAAPAAKRISIRFDGHTLVYELNDSQAAQDLYGQLPATLQAEDYGGNEKIFYPEEKLDTTGAPQAQGGAGTLAYYAPWGDVVLFYGDFSPHSSLFELGQIVSGGELIEEISGEVVVEQVE